MVLDKQQVCVVWTGINKKITECLQQVILSSTTKSFMYNTCSASKLDMIRKVIQDDVQFCWIISTADFEIDDMVTHDLLLYKIVEIFIVMRGFSKAIAWMEKYNSTVC